MRKIVLATTNEGKIREIKSILADTHVTILSFGDFPDISAIPDIIEDGETFFENALKKAKTISDIVGELVFADDSGLEVDYLGGKPGVRSSRYSGDDATDDKNIDKLLNQLKGVPEEKRGASFKCVIVLYRPDGWFESFEGSLRGLISEARAGHGGFGYDPVFYVPEEGITVAQLPPEVKNKISHRAEAVNKLKKWLQKEEILTK